MALIYQPSKRIFCGWFEPLKSTTYSEYPKNEADGEAVAQVFGAFEAEAGTGEVARSHFQAVAAALGDVLVGEAGVDGAVDLDACSGTGACGEERRKGSGRFSKLHDVVFDEVC